MRDALQSYLALAGGLTEITRQRAMAAAKGLAAQGEATADQVTALAEDLITQTRQNSEAVASLVRYEVDRALSNVGLASVDDVTAALEARVRSLEETVRGLTGRGGGSASKAPASKAPASEAPASTPAAATAPAKKAPAKKAPAKKAPAKKAPASGTPTTTPDSTASSTSSASPSSES